MRTRVSSLKKRGEHISLGSRRSLYFPLIPQCSFTLIPAEFTFGAPSVPQTWRFSLTATARQGSPVKPACCKNSIKPQWTGISWNEALTFICSHSGKAMGQRQIQGRGTRRFAVTWTLNEWVSPSSKWEVFSPPCFHRNTGSIHRSSAILEVTCSLYTQKNYLNRHMLNRIYNVKLLSYMWPTFADICSLWVFSITLT